MTRTVGRDTDIGLCIARAAMLVALAIAGYLTYASFALGGRVAGCDDASQAGCSHVLASRWATWLGVPVALPATLVYLTMLAATWAVGHPRGLRSRWLGWTLLTSTAVLVGGAAIWFVGLQLLAIGDLCWYCLTLHSCGLFLACFVAWRLPQEIVVDRRLSWATMVGMGFGVIGLTALVGGQLLLAPREPEMKVVRTDVAVPQASVEKISEKVPAPVSGRVVTHPWGHRRIALLSNGASLDIYDYPVLGDREARQTVVEVFDYTCPHCRQLSGMMNKFETDHGHELAIVLLPIPMNSKCNKFVTVDHANHATACELARLAIAVWQSKPEAFNEFHAALMQGPNPPTPAAAAAEAARLVGDSVLKQALSAPSVDEQLQENCRIYALARDRGHDGAIPKLIVGGTVSSGLPSSEKQLRSFLQTETGVGRKP